MTLRVVPRLNSTYVCVLVSVCYLSLLATDLARSIIDNQADFFLWLRLLVPDGLACSVFVTWPQTCRCFVSSRRFRIPLFRSPRNRCGVCFVGFSPAFCITYEIGACLGVVYAAKPAVVCPSWLFFCFLHYVRHRCLLTRRFGFLPLWHTSYMSYEPFVSFLFCTTYVMGAHI